MDIPALTTEQMVEVDRLMVTDYGVELIQMMENAGRNLAELVLRMLSASSSKQSVCVLCGLAQSRCGCSSHPAGW